MSGSETQNPPPQGQQDEAELLRAFGLHKAGEFAAALEIYEAVLRRDPANASCLNLMGSALGALGRPADAAHAIRAAIEFKPSAASYRVNLGVVLRAMGQAAEAADTYRTAIALAPDNAAAHGNLGNALRDLGQLDEALACCMRAVALKPDDVELLLNAADLRQATKDFQGAVELYDAALRLAPRHALALRCKSAALLSQGDIPRAIECARLARERDPQDPAGCNNLGLALQAAGRHDEALDVFAQALSLAPDNAAAQMNSAICNLVRGDFADGFQRYEWRWQASKEKLPDAGVPQWRGEGDIAGKRILFHAEQGFGDTIQFARYAKLAVARGASVVLSVPPALVRLMAGMPDVAEVVAHGETLLPVDLQCPVMSLALAFGTRIETIPAEIPYLRADAAVVEVWRKRLGAKTKARIGLVWSGNAAHRNDRNRSVPLAALAPILEARCEFVSLQKDLRPDDGAFLARNPQVRYFGYLLDDFSETAALAANMDLVLCVDTSVLHLVGAMGIAALALIPFNPDWRWLLERNDTPWYPTVRLVRQTRPGDWSDCLATVARELRHLTAVRDQ